MFAGPIRGATGDVPDAGRGAALQWCTWHAARPLKDVFADLAGDECRAPPTRRLRGAAGTATCPPTSSPRRWSAIADTAPVEVAEHLAPFVMAHSAVPAARDRGRRASRPSWVGAARHRAARPVDADLDGPRARRRRDGRLRRDRRSPALADDAATSAAGADDASEADRGRRPRAPDRRRRRWTTSRVAVDGRVRRPTADDAGRRRSSRADVDLADAGRRADDDADDVDAGGPRRLSAGHRGPGQPARPESASMPSHERTATRAATTISCAVSGFSARRCQRASASLGRRGQLGRRRRRRQAAAAGAARRRRRR